MKRREALKVIGVSALCIGVLASAFIGINSGAFLVSASGVTEISAPMVVTANVDTETDVGISDSEYILEDGTGEVGTQENISELLQQTVTPREGFIEPTFSMYVPEGSAGCENALNPEDAVLVGAQYIWEIFGESIDGKFVWLTYWDFPSYTRTYWVGTVGNSREDIEGQIQRSFSFAIDGVTGEWIDVANFNAFRDSTTPAAQAKIEGFSANGLYEAGTRITEVWDSIDNESYLHPDQLDDYLEVVIDSVARHFVNTSIVSVDFVNIRATVLDVDGNGNFISRANSLRFTATDSTGRIADVFLDEETMSVVMITTMDNDLFPGITPDIIEEQ